MNIAPHIARDDAIVVGNGAAMMKEELDRLEAKLDSEARGIRGEIREVREEIRTNHRHMLILHEEVIDRIAALAPDFGPIRREFRQADEDLKENIERRLQPLEAAVRRRYRRKN